MKTKHTELKGEQVTTVLTGKVSVKGKTKWDTGIFDTYKQSVIKLTKEDKEGLLWQHITFTSNGKPKKYWSLTVDDVTIIESDYKKDCVNAF